jgi:hypothetical protein
VSENTVKMIITADACGLDFFGRGEVRCLHCMPGDFSVGSEWLHHVSLPSTVHLNNASPAVLYSSRSFGDSDT